MNNTVAFRLVILQAIMSGSLVSLALLLGGWFTFDRWPGPLLLAVLLAFPLVLPLLWIFEYRRTGHRPPGLEPQARKTLERWQQASLLGRVGVLFISWWVVGGVLVITTAWSLVASLALSGTIPARPETVLAAASVGISIIAAATSLLTRGRSKPISDEHPNYDLPRPTPTGGHESWLRLRTGRLNSQLVRLSLEGTTLALVREDGTQALRIDVEAIESVGGNSLSLELTVNGHPHPYLFRHPDRPAGGEGFDLSRRLMPAWRALIEKARIAAEPPP